VWPIVFGVVGCYAAAVLGIHLYFRHRRKREEASRHYVLMAADHEREMEWVLRSIQWYGIRTGVDVRVTVVDEGSRDDTLRIAGVLGREGGGIEVRRREGPDGMPVKRQNRHDSCEAAPPDYGRSRTAVRIGNPKLWERLRRSVPCIRSRTRASAPAAGAVRGDAPGTSDHGRGESGQHPAAAHRGVHWFWLLHPEGTYGVNGLENHVLIDLRNPGDLEKLP